MLRKFYKVLLFGLCSVVSPVVLGNTETLRVCADPHNLPFSDNKRAGYENKIAELFAEELGADLRYVWFPQRIGFIRNTLRNLDAVSGRFKCDLVLGVPENFELAATSKPYMHSSWAMVYVKGRGLDYIKKQEDLQNVDIDRSQNLRIGVWDRGPVAKFVLEAGLMGRAVPYQIMTGDSQENPGKIITRDLLGDKINLTFVWGPIAGYFAKMIEDEQIEVIPMRSTENLVFDFKISMAVRYGENEWLMRVNNFIEDKQHDIDGILRQFGVPMITLTKKNPHEINLETRK